jgi:hypothetical protein
MRFDHVGDTGLEANSDTERALQRGLRRNKLVLITEFMVGYENSIGLPIIVNLTL